MMKSTFAVYIDESGDDGFAFERGSPEWFVISAVVVRRAQEKTILELVDKVRVILGRKDRDPLHFRKLDHPKRIPLLKAIAEAPIAAMSVLLHKPSLKNHDGFRQGDRLYFYLSRYLLERVSWYCRDERTNDDTGDGSAEVIFSHRGEMSYLAVKKYLERLRQMQDVRIDWKVIKPEQVEVFAPVDRVSLQVVDAVAGSMYHALVPKYGYVEDAYVKMLKPVIYSRKGVYLGYGLKFWPAETADMLKTEEQLGWVRTHYR